MNIKSCPRKTRTESAYIFQIRTNRVFLYLSSKEGKFFFSQFAANFESAFCVFLLETTSKQMSGSSYMLEICEKFPRSLSLPFYTHHAPVFFTSNLFCQLSHSYHWRYFFYFHFFKLMIVHHLSPIPSVHTGKKTCYVTRRVLLWASTIFWEK